MFALIRSLSLRRLLPTLLVLLGIALLGYSAAQYGRMYFAQKRLAREWREQNQRAQTRTVPATNVEAGAARLIRLVVPKIALDSIVMEGTSRRALLLGPGHMKGSATPGESGNAVITAHRDTFFRHIHELQKGDEIVVQRDGRVYRFEVTGKKVVEPDDMSVIRGSGESRLTLITCYPTYYIGPAPQRLVVFSKLVEQAPAHQKSAGTTAGAPAAVANAQGAVH